VATHTRTPTRSEQLVAYHTSKALFTKAPIAIVFHGTNAKSAVSLTKVRPCVCVLCVCVCVCTQRRPTAPTAQPHTSSFVAYSRSDPPLNSMCNTHSLDAKQLQPPKTDGGVEGAHMVSWHDRGQVCTTVCTHPGRCVCVDTLVGGEAYACA
jgi:hypothetical protein